jgi:hypothetical protein
MSPSIQLLHTLVEVDNKGERHLPIGCAIMNLMEQNKFDLALPFIQEMQNKPSKGKTFTITNLFMKSNYLKVNFNHINAD